MASDRHGGSGSNRVGSYKLSFEATTSEPPSHLVTLITDKGIPFGGSWDYRIVPDGAGSRITITENGEVYNPTFRFMSKYVMGHTATQGTNDGCPGAFNAFFRLRDMLSAGWSHWEQLVGPDA